MSDTDRVGESLSATVLGLHRQARYRRWFGPHLAAALALFVASAYAGYAILGALPVEELMDLFPGGSPLPDFAFLPIALNNLRVLVMMFLGPVTGGLVSVFGLVVNGFLVGSVVAIVLQETGWVVILAALAPHGVLELPAFFIAAAVAFRVTHRVARYLTGYDDAPLTRVEAFELAVLVAVTALMIVVAAWIEVAVTPEVIRMVGGDVPAGG